MLGYDENDRSFDTDIIVYINSCMLFLSQNGIGPTEGFKIKGREEKWSDLISDNKCYEAVKEYIYLKVKLVFDPPSSSYVISAFKEMINELEGRLNIQSDYS